MRSRYEAVLLAFIPLILLLSTACNTSSPPPMDAAPPPTSTAPAPTSPVGNAEPEPAATSTATAVPVPTIAPAESRILVQTSATTNYYPVYGTSSQQIVDYVLAYGPQAKDGLRGIGLAHPAPTLSWQPETLSGSCIISSMSLDMAVKVTLPKHAQLEALSPGLSKLWNTLSEHVAWHEQRHVDIFFEGMNEIKREMIAIEPRRDGCASLRTEVERLWDRGIARITPRQDAFHAQEDARHNALREELRQRYVASDSRIAALAGQITSADGKIHTIEAELANTEARLNTLSVQLEDIRRMYGEGALPAPAFNLYESVRAEYNALILTSRDIYAKYQTEVAGRNALATEHDGLVTTRNGLVDAYNLAP